MVFFDKSEALVEQLYHFHIVLRGVGFELSSKRLCDLEVQRREGCRFRIITVCRGLGWPYAPVFRSRSRYFRHAKVNSFPNGRLEAN